jgi:hypothetical protein
MYIYIHTHRRSNSTAAPPPPPPPAAASIPECYDWVAPVTIANASRRQAAPPERERAAPALALAAATPTTPPPTTTPLPLDGGRSGRETLDRGAAAAASAAAAAVGGGGSGGGSSDGRGRVAYVGGVTGLDVTNWGWGNGWRLLGELMGRGSVRGEGEDQGRGGGVSRSGVGGGAEPLDARASAQTHTPLARIALEGLVDAVGRGQAQIR